MSILVIKKLRLSIIDPIILEGIIKKISPLASIRVLPQNPTIATITHTSHVKTRSLSIPSISLAKRRLPLLLLSLLFLLLVLHVQLSKGQVPTQYRLILLTSTTPSANRKILPHRVLLWVLVWTLLVIHETVW